MTAPKFESGCRLLIESQEPLQELLYLRSFANQDRKGSGRGVGLLVDQSCNHYIVSQNSPSIPYAQGVYRAHEKPPSAVED